MPPLHAPALHAVAKYSLKRNGDLRSHRACERAVAELGLLVGTHAVLTKGERESLLFVARPLVLSAPTGRRLPSLTLLCRGFFSPGFSSFGSWRSQKIDSCTAMTLSRPWRGCTNPRVFSQRFSISGFRVQSHSRSIRSALPYLELPRRIWQTSIGGLEGWQDSANESEKHLRANHSALSLQGGVPHSGDALDLLIAVASDGVEGTSAIRTLRDWACSALEEGLQDASDPLSGTPPLARGSPAAVCLCNSHGALVKGRRRGRSRWLASTARVGCMVQLMTDLATRHVAEQYRGGSAGEHFLPDRELGESTGLAQTIVGLTLVYSLLERATSTRPSLHNILIQREPDVNSLWSLVDNTILESLSAQGSGASNSDQESPVDRPSAVANMATARSTRGSSLSTGLLRLKKWRRPHLLFDFLAIHQASDAASRADADDTEAIPLAPIIQRWLRALLRLPMTASGVLETLHELRCKTPPNLEHFKRLGAASPHAKQVVESWIQADELDCELSTIEDNCSAVGNARVVTALSAPSGLPGVCGAEDLFMLGEDLQTCMRIAPDCSRENAALLSFTAQGNVRLLLARDFRSRSIGMTGINRIAGRAVARLLARSDTGEPVLFVDQPLFAGWVSEGGRTHADMSEAERLTNEDHEHTSWRTLVEDEIKQQALDLASKINVPLFLWKDCSRATKLKVEDAKDMDDAVPRQVHLVEYDGLSPVAYCNFEGVLRRTPQVRSIRYVRLQNHVL